MKIVSANLHLPNSHELRANAVTALAARYGLTTEQVFDLAIILAGHALQWTATSPVHHIAFGELRECHVDGCDCSGVFAAQVVFELPKPVAAANVTMH